MRVVVPFAVGEPKSRLAPALGADERAAFARASLEDVLEAVRAAGGEPTVLATADPRVDAETVVDERSLTAAVNAAIADAGPPVAVVMADLALATGEAVTELLAADGEVVLVPGRGGGTNAIVVRHPEFRVDYHGASYRDHLAIAREIGADVGTVDSYRLSTDVDEPADLVEVLLHGRSRSQAVLEDAGFVLDVDDGRVRAGREGRERA